MNHHRNLAFANRCAGAAMFATLVYLIFFIAGVA